jgi:hypothetical protein
LAYSVIRHFAENTPWSVGLAGSLYASLLRPGCQRGDVNVRFGAKATELLQAVK